MEKDDVQKMIAQTMSSSAMNAQYGISRVPVHTHNGLDSPKIDFGGGLVNRQFFESSHVFGTNAATAGNYGHFYIHSLNLSPASILVISEVHGRAGSDGGTVTVSLAALKPGDASLTGGTVVATFNLKTAANEPDESSLIVGQTPIVLYPGDRLALQTSGTLTNVADVLVTVLLQY